MTDVLFPDYRYDVGISYSRKDKEFVQPVVDHLIASGVRVFFDSLVDIEAMMVGRDLAYELPKIYRDGCAYCIVFISKNYAQSEWTKFELRNALGRQIRTEAYIKPVKLDDTKLDDLPDTIAFLDARPGRIYADHAVLCQQLLNSITHRGEFSPAQASEPPEAQPETDAKEERIGPKPSDYFDVILPAMLKFKGLAATKPNTSMRYIVTGKDGGSWLVRLAPPQAAVVQLSKDDDISKLMCPAHLTLKITDTEMRNMLLGTFDARQAIIEGNVEFNGDLGVLRAMGSLFSQPPHR
jgi:hypothetical protein